MTIKFRTKAELRSKLDAANAAAYEHAYADGFLPAELWLELVVAYLVARGDPDKAVARMLDTPFARAQLDGSAW